MVERVAISRALVTRRVSAALEAAPASVLVGQCLSAAAIMFTSWIHGATGMYANPSATAVQYPLAALVDGAALRCTAAPDARVRLYCCLCLSISQKHVPEHVRDATTYV